MYTSGTFVTQNILLLTLKETKQQEISPRFLSASTANGADDADLLGK